MAIFGASESDGWIGAIGVAAGIILTAVTKLLVNYSRTRGANAVAEEELKQKGDARTFSEMRTILRDAVARITVLDAKVEARDEKIEELINDVAECRADRSALAERTSWMENTLREKGLPVYDRNKGVDNNKKPPTNSDRKG